MRQKVKDLVKRREAPIQQRRTSFPHIPEVASLWVLFSQPQGRSNNEGLLVQSMRVASFEDIASIRLASRTILGRYSMWVPNIIIF
jgi:hypothetical protein